MTELTFSPFLFKNTIQWSAIVRHYFVYTIWCYRHSTLLQQTTVSSKQEEKKFAKRWVAAKKSFFGGPQGTHTLNFLGFQSLITPCSEMANNKKLAYDPWSPTILTLCLKLLYINQNGLLRPYLVWHRQKSRAQK